MILKDGPRKWQVDLVESREELDPANAARTDFRKQLITIDRGQSREEVEQSLFHELVHIGLWRAGIKVKEDRQVDSLARTLYDFLKMNGLLSRWNLK